MPSTPAGPTPAPQLVSHATWHELRISQTVGRGIGDHTPVFSDTNGPLVVDLRQVVVVTSPLCSWLMRLARERPARQVTVVCAPQGQAVLRLLHLDAILAVRGDWPATGPAST